jgi:hypothetical protein
MCEKYFRQNAFRPIAHVFDFVDNHHKSMVFFNISESQNSEFWVFVGKEKAKPKNCSFWLVS